jgi:tetratricopeptide (TPR) repeat protein
LKLTFLGVLLLVFSNPAVGQEVEREELSVIGWNNACSVAFSQYGYPALGQAAHDEPVRARVGTLTIKPGAQSSQASWDVDFEGAESWSAPQVKQAISQLAVAGYKNPGLVETILPDSGDVLISTISLALRSTKGWPGPQWLWHQIFYSPLGDCGLFVFRKAHAEHPVYRTLLLRLYSPGARTKRAQEHLAAANRLLEDKMDLAAAVAEAEIAARMAPGFASARYRFAVMLCMSGRLDEAEGELAAALKLDPALKAQARADQDFESLRGSARFKEAVKE